MRIYVLFNDAERTKATIEFRPNWFSRKILRRRSSFGIAVKVSTSGSYSREVVWRWADSNRLVSSEVLDAIEVRPEEVVEFEKANPPPEPLPTAKVVSGA